MLRYLVIPFFISSVPYCVPSLFSSLFIWLDRHVFLAFVICSSCLPFVISFSCLVLVFAHSFFISFVLYFVSSLFMYLVMYVFRPCVRSVFLSYVIYAVMFFLALFRSLRLYLCSSICL